MAEANISNRRSTLRHIELAPEAEPTRKSKKRKKVRTSESAEGVGVGNYSRQHTFKVTFVFYKYLFYVFFACEEK